VKSLLGALVFLVLLTALAGVGPAAADPYHGGHRHGGWHGHRDWDGWRSGYWHHGWHGGRLGWWWVVGGLWSFYSAPIYPYPSLPVVVARENPPPVVVEPNSPGAPPSGEGGYWYYCSLPKGYYPYVRECRRAWKAVSATPPGEVR
jgi:hypothetical protein